MFFTTKPREPDQLDVLLGRGDTAGPGREQVLAAALERARIGSRQRDLRTLFLGLVPAFVGAGVVLLAIRTQPDSAFTARGAALARTPQLQVACSATQSERCPRGARLLFRVADVSQAGYLAAYAENERGERIWFLPQPGQPMAAVPAQAGTQVLAQAAQLTDAVPTGRYQVHLLLSRTPLERERVLVPAPTDVLAHTQTSLEITP
jgi:hypothetical protein